jgi:hypothetical protein
MKPAHCRAQQIDKHRSTEVGDSSVTRTSVPSERHASGQSARWPLKIGVSEHHASAPTPAHEWCSTPSKVNGNAHAPPAVSHTKPAQSFAYQKNRQAWAAWRWHRPMQWLALPEEKGLHRPCQMTVA